MRWMTDVLFRLRAIFAPGKMERELDEEVAFHLEMETTKYVERGMSEEEARRQALRNFGSVPLKKEHIRGTWRVGVARDLGGDVRIAFRQLRRNPTFAAVGVLTLGLGIGATTAMFSVVNAVLLRPLPFDEPDRIVRLRTLWDGEDRFGTASYPDIIEWRDRSNAFEDVAVVHGWRPTLTTDHGPVVLSGVSVSASYFDILGVRPALGRFFLREEDAPGHEPVVVLSHALWQRELGGDESVLGRSVVLSDLRDEDGGRSYVVVGITSADYESPLGATVNLNLWRSTQEYYTRWHRRNRALFAVARLRPGLKLEDAQLELDVLTAQLEEENPVANEGIGVRLVSVKEVIMGRVRPMLLVLFAAVALVLLIASANVANLLLSRATARRREIALRMSLGASRGRLVAQLLTESVVLAGTGAVLGLGIAAVATPAMLGLAGSTIPRAEAIHVDGPVLAFTMVLALLTAALFGLAPALSASASRLATTLREGGRGTVRGGSGPNLRRGLVVAEIAMSLVLLAGAGLLIRSYANLLAVPSGVRTEDVLTFRLSPAPGDVPDQRLSDYYREVEERLRALPGVAAVGSTFRLPLTRSNICTGVSHGVGEWGDDDDDRCAEYRSFTNGYPETLGLELVRGRAFTTADHAQGEGVSPAIINEAMVRMMFPEEEPLGRFIGTGIGTSHEIIGVARDVRIHGLAQPAVAAVYVPHARAPGWIQRTLYVTIRTEGDPLAILPAARRAVWEVEETVPITRVRTMEEIAAADVASPRFRTFLLTTFAFLATALATIGVAGLMAYTVAQRTPEIAVRIALGAGAGDVVHMVVAQALKLAAVGIVIGLLGAAGLTRLLSSLLFGVEPIDATTFVGVALLLGLISVGASYLPARRAAGIEPVRLLNSE